MSTMPFDIQKLLKNNPYPNYVHFVLPGSVVSGQPALEHDTDTIHLYRATVYAGAASVEVESLIVAIDKIMAWGDGAIDLA